MTVVQPAARFDLHQTALARSRAHGAPLDLVQALLAGFELHVTPKLAVHYAVRTLSIYVFQHDLVLQHLSTKGAWVSVHTKRTHYRKWHAKP
jgi:hypothetical protein